MIGAAQLADMQRAWCAYLSDESGTAVEHPNNFLDVIWCSVDQETEQSYELSIQVNIRDRGHCAVCTLPKKLLLAQVRFWERDGHTYLVVDQGWFEQLRRGAFSLYAFIDIAGMRQYLKEHGQVADEAMQCIRQGLDSVAAEHRDCVFFTLADSVLIKSNWAARPESGLAEYQPERFLDVVKRTQDVIRRALDLGSYAVVTQGANQVRDSALVHVSESGNHILFPCLSTPFAQLFEIEKVVRDLVRDKPLAKRELYLSKGLVLSLKFREHEARESALRNLVSYKSRQQLTSPDESALLAVDYSDLRQDLVE